MLLTICEMMKELGRKSSSSDEEEEGEEDRQNLIPQNETKPTSNSHSFSAFHIDDDDFTSSVRRFRLDFRRFREKRYLLVILIPLVVVLLYFSVDFGNLFHNSSIWDVKFVGSSSSSSDLMRESELRALYLLKQQQSGLVSLLDRALGNKAGIRSNSTVNNSLSYLNSSESVVEKFDFEDVKSRIYNQILLNKQIQQVLLATHKNGNVSELGGESGDLGDGEINMCGKVNQKFSERRTIEWKPEKNKYLLAICVSGQMSNHLICLEKHMFFAAVMNRVLVIPSSKVDYQYNRVLDVERINSCVGRKVVITFEEFYEMKKKDMRIDKFICYFSLPQHCYVDEDHVKKLKALGLSIPKLESPWTEDVKNPSKRTVQDIEAKFTTNDEVIAIGDVFFADVEKEWVLQPGGPIAHKCKTLIEPSRFIMLTAQRFIQTFLGKDYVALHFRRHGFLKFCNVKKPSCFYPVPQAADCITRVVERANMPVIYLSTDAAESETGLLQSLIVVDGKPIPLVKRPARNSAEKWDALLYRHDLDGDSQVEAMLDKTICAMSSVFIGSSGSTFTEDILRLRKDWGSASVCDEYICQGELPNFIAEDE
ncbi:O-fucosyltransferase 36, variant 2 [Ancistrocladus abbreviatus]